MSANSVIASVNITLSRQNVPTFFISGYYGSSGPQNEIFYDVQPGDCVRRVGLQPGGTGFDYAEFTGLQAGDIATAWGPVQQFYTSGPYTGFLSSPREGSGCRGEAVDTWAEPGGIGRWRGGRRAAVQGASYVRLRPGNGGGWTADLEGIQAFVSGGAKVAAKVVESCTAAAVAILEGGVGGGGSGQRRRDGQHDGAGIGTMETVFERGEQPNATVCWEALRGWAYPDLIQIDGVDYTPVRKGGLIYESTNGEVVDMRDTFEDASDITPRPYDPDSSQPVVLEPVATNQPSSPFKTSHDQQIEPSQVPTTISGGDVDSSAPELSLLTAHRLSATSLKDASLGEGAQDTGSDQSQSSTIAFNDTASARQVPPKLPPRSSDNSVPKAQGLSGPLPTVPWNPPPPPPPLPPPDKSKILTPAPPSRKLTSPFSWLTRNTSSAKDINASPVPALPQATDRRNTASSLATINSNSDHAASKVDDGHESDSPARPGRNSLRDRFKLLRMREEAGISSLTEEDATSPIGGGGALAGLIGRSTGLGLGVGSPTSLVDEKEGGLAGLTAQSHTATASSPRPLTVNPSLPPGTASGISAGPSAMTDPAAPVDWDLWQSVVYEGPAAVARTSPEELNRAIISGIPSAIRGVVWQVLAQSKNEELEGVYRDLLTRGTGKDRERISDSSQLSERKPSIAKIDTLNGNAKEKDSIISSASSVHSDHSTPAHTTNGITSPTPSQDQDAVNASKLQANLLAEKRKKKAKEDAAALQKLEKSIKRDLGARTSYSKYAVSAGLQDGLFGVCKAYALFDDGVGYAQGMNFLVMPLLFNMPEEEAFCLLVRLMNQYHLRDMFTQDMPGLHLHLYQFERLLEDLEPALYCHLRRRGVTPQLYATQWFLTLFAYRLPLQLVLRVYDLILSDGLETAILKFGLVLMQKNAATLRSLNDMTALTTFLKDKLFDVYIDRTPSANSILESGFFGSSGGIDKDVYRADILVQDACAVNMTPESLKTYTAEWEEKARLEREREAELEGLRSSNSTLSTKVRSLEERAEKFDTEHVQVASELVRTKVENDELKDENESLKGQVAELREVIQRQPEEIEKRLKDEMDRIMTRNSEVHNENRALEDQMAEMEKQLVDTKMQYAEKNSDHETLKQKWNDLRKALGD
ncbi:MAG: GTPase-activating protein [Candelina mexicana]|nr:MAG: GTPase-activating protein [Candelina mexicana]